MEVVKNKTEGKEEIGWILILPDSIYLAKNIIDFVESRGLKLASVKEVKVEDYC